MGQSSAKYRSLPTAFLSTEADTRRLTGLSLGYTGSLYLHFGLGSFGLVPLWTLFLSAPILIVRWMLSVHELFHLPR